MQKEYTTSYGDKHTHIHTNARTQAPFSPFIFLHRSEEE